MKFPGINDARYNAVVIPTDDVNQNAGIGDVADIPNTNNLDTAKFIVRACNSHEAFAEMAYALNSFLLALTSDEDAQRALARYPNMYNNLRERANTVLSCLDREPL